MRLIAIPLGVRGKLTHSIFDLVFDLSSWVNRYPSYYYNRPYYPGGSYYPTRYPTTGSGYYPNYNQGYYPNYNTGYYPNTQFGYGAQGSGFGGGYGGYGGFGGELPISFLFLFRVL